MLVPSTDSSPGTLFSRGSLSLQCIVGDVDGGLVAVPAVEAFVAYLTGTDDELTLPLPLKMLMLVLLSTNSSGSLLATYHQEDGIIVVPAVEAFVAYLVGTDDGPVDLLLPSKDLSELLRVDAATFLPRRRCCPRR